MLRPSYEGPFRNIEGAFLPTVTKEQKRLLGQRNLAAALYSFQRTSILLLFFEIHMGPLPTMSG